MASLAYTYQNGRYINLTSRCPTACSFCIKFSWDYLYRSHDLKLKKEPLVDEVMEAVGTDLSQFDEVVFCGYGESTYRLGEMAQLSPLFRERGARRIRLNTIGLGNLIHNRDITSDLSLFLDAVSISLNTMDPRQYVEIHRPLPEFRERAFQAACDFARACALAVADTTVTAIGLPKVDTARVQDFARSIGAQFRLRHLLDEYENR